MTRKPSIDEINELIEGPSDATMSDRAIGAAHWKGKQASNFGKKAPEKARVALKSGWTPERRAAQADMMRARRSSETFVANMKSSFTEERRERQRASQLGQKRTGDFTTNKKKRCTVDDITFYDSKKEMIAALGNGRVGARNPNFRYVK